MNLLNLHTNRFGAFKREIKDAQKILSFTALNINTYHLTYATKEQGMLQKFKVCGFQLNSAVNSKTLPHDLFQSFLSKALNDEMVSKPIVQVRHFTNGLTQESRKKILNYQLRNSIKPKKIVVKKSGVLLPYGSTKEMIVNAEKE